MSSRQSLTDEERARLERLQLEHLEREEVARLEREEIARLEREEERKLEEREREEERKLEESWKGVKEGTGIGCVIGILVFFVWIVWNYIQRMI